MLETRSSTIGPDEGCSPKILHLGCGDSYLPGALNVDPFRRSVCDLLARGQSLPLADGCMDEVRLTHVLEHIGYLGSIETLAECLRVLRPNGLLAVETPAAEPTVQAFLESTSVQGDPAGLTHLFGRPGDQGMGHQALLPEKLLYSLLEQAGFTAIEQEPPCTRLDRPGLRLVAKRSSDPRFLLLARCRQRLAAAGLLAGMSEAERLELEERFFAVLRDLPELSAAQASEGLLELILISPQMALSAFALLQQASLPCRAELEDLSRVASEAEQIGFDHMLWQALRHFAVTASDVDDPLQRIEDEVRSLLAELRRGFGPSLAAELHRRLKPAQRGHSFASFLEGFDRLFPRQGAFLRSRVRSAASAILARAIAELSRGRLRQGRRGLLLAANLRQDRVYPTWNMAVLQARFGNLERAISFYRAARFGSPATAITAALEHEEASCLFALGQGEEAAWLWQRSQAMARRLAGQTGELFPAARRRQREGAVVARSEADLAVAPSADGADEPLTAFPSPRIRPVLVGEAWTRLP